MKANIALGFSIIAALLSLLMIYFYFNPTRQEQFLNWNRFMHDPVAISPLPTNKAASASSVVVTASPSALKKPLLSPTPSSKLVK